MNRKKSPYQKSTNIRTLIKTILKNALDSINPQPLVIKNLKIKKNWLYFGDEEIDLRRFHKIHVIGAGKAVYNLYTGLEKVLGGWISGGVVVTLNKHSLPAGRVRFYTGTHPIPDINSLHAGEAVFKYIKEEVGKNDLVFFLNTGGASSLLIKPVAGLKLNDKIKIHECLLSSGADINEINCVRKHISALKGGRLAEEIYPAKLISLILSDIVDSKLEDIGSGFSIGDSTTFYDAFQILQKYHLFQQLGPEIKKFFMNGVEGKVPETPIPALNKFKKNKHVLLGNNTLALSSAKTTAEQMGIKAVILTSRDKGEASEVAKVYASIIKEIISHQNPFKPPVLLLSGGELTVTIRGSGKGGRNQEFVLEILNQLKEIHSPFHILSVGTDGIDGPTDAAGAWINEKTIKKVKKLNMNINTHLSNNDSYHFFKKINQLIITGPTDTNVMDLRLFYIH